MPTLYQVDRGRLVVSLHPGQQRAWDSNKRIVAIIAGGRSGKTSFAPLWLHREMLQHGPGDYLVAAPNYPLIDKAVGPEMQHFFESLLGVGTLRRSPFQMAIHPEGAARLWGKAPERPARILFGHADEPQSLEALSAKAAVLDEAGQTRFRLESWEAVQQRLALDRGRCLITSKPYNMGWLKQKVYDPWDQARRAGQDHPEIDVISFDSRWNPVFPAEEWDRARATLPGWKFDMQFRGLFTRPAGLVYDCFDRSVNTCPRFQVPARWPRYLGLDFGPVNTAAVFLAEEQAPDFPHPPTGRLIAYREYHAGGRSSSEHVKALLAGEPRQPLAVGGAPRTEQGWRDAFASGGLAVREPAILKVEPGIDRVYGTIKTGQLVLMDDLDETLEQLESYSYALDEQGEATDKLDDPHPYHALDALRYVVGWLRGGPVAAVPTFGPPLAERLAGAAPSPFGRQAPSPFR